MYKGTFVIADAECKGGHYTWNDVFNFHLVGVGSEEDKTQEIFNFNNLNHNAK